MLDVQAALADPVVIDDPYAFYDSLREAAPVCPVPGADVVLVSTWDLVAEATARVEDFSNHFRHTLYRDEAGRLAVLHHYPAGEAADVFAGADPPDHAGHRKVFFPELVTSKMDALEADVRRVTDQLLDPLVDGSEADVTAGLANLLPVVVVADFVVGFHDADHEQIATWVHAGSNMLGGRLGLADMGEAAMAAAGLLPWVDEQLDAALSAPSTAGAGDVLTAAASGVREGVLTREQASFALTVVVGAGAETTTGLIGNAVRLLAERPALQAALRDDLDLVPAYVEEVLRYESPFRFHPRTATCDTELGGVAVPERSMVLLMWSAANRDPAAFDEPHTFRVGRPNVRRHLAFGRGIHHCVGAVLARLEARVAVTRLLERTRSFTLDGSAPPRWLDNLWIRRHETLPLRVDAI